MLLGIILTLLGACTLALSMTFQRYGLGAAELCGASSPRDAKPHIFEPLLAHTRYGRNLESRLPTSVGGGDV